MNRSPMPIKKRFSPEERIRLIENWLPLVQSTNQQLGWNLDSGSLEALIVKSAPDLRCCCTAIEAYTVLVSHYINYSQKER